MLFTFAIPPLIALLKLTPYSAENFYLILFWDQKSQKNEIFKLDSKDDGQHLALVSSDNLIQVLASNHLDKQGVVFNGHTETIRSIDLSHNCKYLISASNDKTCKIWSLTKPNELLLDIQSIKSNDSAVS
jgi:WD40 repeat protein